jgi:multidrug efflux pump subunit AcrB
MHALVLDQPSRNGLVLAIGIVVDDAMVVENVERHIASGSRPGGHRRAWTGQRTDHRHIALVLCAVFVPIGFIPGRPVSSTSSSRSPSPSPR